MNETSAQIMQKVVDILKDKLANNVEVINISEMTIIADYFVIASGRTDSHVRALCDYVDEGIKEALDMDPLHREGLDGSKWIVLDYGSVIVHLFHNEEREFYNIEKLWAEAPRVNIED